MSQVGLLCCCSTGPPPPTACVLLPGPCPLTAGFAASCSGSQVVQTGPPFAPVLWDLTWSMSCSGTLTVVPGGGSLNPGRYLARLSFNEPQNDAGVVDAATMMVSGANGNGDEWPFAGEYDLQSEDVFDIEAIARCSESESVFSPLQVELQATVQLAGAGGVSLRMAAPHPAVCPVPATGAELLPPLSLTRYDPPTGLPIVSTIQVDGSSMVVA